jgi:hypothetical protein
VGEALSELEISGEERWRVVAHLLTQLEGCRSFVMELMNEPGSLPLATYAQQVRAVAHAINRAHSVALNYTNSATITLRQARDSEVQKR